MTFTISGLTYEVYTDSGSIVSLLENLYPPDTVILVDPSEVSPIVSDGGDVDLQTSENTEDIDGGDLDSGVSLTTIDPDSGNFDTGLAVLVADAWLGTENSPGTTLPGIVYDPEIEFGTVLVDADNLEVSVTELPETQGSFIPQVNIDIESKFELKIGLVLGFTQEILAFSYGPFDFDIGFALDFQTVNNPLLINADFGSIAEDVDPILPSGIY